MLCSYWLLGTKETLNKKLTEVPSNILKPTLSARLSEHHASTPYRVLAPFSTASPHSILNLSFASLPPTAAASSFSSASSSSCSFSFLYNPAILAMSFFGPWLLYWSSFSQFSPGLLALLSSLRLLPPTPPLMVRSILLAMFSLDSSSYPGCILPRLFNKNPLLNHT